jgi:predicted dehydrogenase
MCPNSLTPFRILYNYLKLIYNEIHDFRFEGDIKMIQFKVGLLGAGAISAIIADTLNDLDGFTPYAIASRDKEKADNFGKEHNIDVCYGSYDELINDPEVELVYVGTVHSTHADLAKKCIEAGKPVLVEKPFSYNAKTAGEVLQLAKEKQVFCGEAMWLRYLPMMKLIVDIVNTGLIGDARTFVASLGYDLKDHERVTSLETAGGALLDVGVYPITMAFMMFGSAPSAVASNFSRLKSGVDAMSTLQMSFPKGKFATVTMSMIGNLDNRGIVYGTAGRLEIDNVNCPTNLKIFGPNGTQTQEFNVKDKDKNGYEYQFMSARQAIIVGRAETPENKPTDIMALYSFTDAIRKTWKLAYPLPGEEKVD